MEAALISNDVRGWIMAAASGIGASASVACHVLLKLRKLTTLSSMHFRSKYYLQRPHPPKIPKMAEFSDTG
jgi:hypothetical protein